MTLNGILSRHLSTDFIETEMREVLEENGLIVQGSKGFLNQSTVKSDRASVKLFTNGSFQYTGAQNLVAFVETMDRLCNTLDVMLEQVSIANIQMKFACNRSIPLPEIQNRLGISYDPDFYAGARGSVERDGVSSNLVTFSTGRVILNSASPTHLHVIYKVTCDALDSIYEGHHTNIHGNGYGNSKGKHTNKYMIHRGYSSRLALFNLEDWS